MLRTVVAGESAPEPLAIRGYVLEKVAQRELTFHEPGSFVIDDGPQCCVL